MEPTSTVRFQPIAELVADADFPASAVGKSVDIAGNRGVVTEIVRNSIKVRQEEGPVLSYNYHTLRRLYGPRVVPEEQPRFEPPTPAAEKVEQPKPKADEIETPNFDAPLVPIEQLMVEPDFPKSALGRLANFHGFNGVIVQVLGPSLRARSREGATRTYNVAWLRKTYSSGNAF